MQEVNIKKIIKKCILYYSAFGIVIGVILFFLSLFDPTLTFHMLDVQYHGLQAGIIGIFFVPVIMGIVGAGHAVLLWFPGILIYRKLSRKRTF